MSDTATIKSLSSCALNSCPGMILALHEIKRLRDELDLCVRAPGSSAALDGGSDGEVRGPANSRGTTAGA